MQPVSLEHDPARGCGPLIPPSEGQRPLRQQVFERIRAAGRIPRVQLARELGVSPASVTTITSEGDDYAKVVAAAARKAGLRVEIDLRNEKINYKVREHSLAKIPALLVVGKKEAESHSVSVRRLGSDGQTVMSTAEAISALVEEATPPDVKRARES